MSSERQELGALAESVACEYLESRGYEVLCRNYRKPWGELDIVARIDGIIVVVEVKANRKMMSDFDPEIRADDRKMHKVARTATLFIERELKAMDIEWRIDVISVTFDEPNRKAHLKHFKNAYEARG